MRRLIMWNLITIDGHFEGTKSWEIDWHKHVVDDEFDELSQLQFASADLLLFGRVTYEGMSAYWSARRGGVADLMNNIPKRVYSRTLPSADWSNTELIREDVAGDVRTLKHQPGKDILVFGSANLSSTLMQHDLIDEYRIGVAPIMLGEGRPLFKASTATRRLELLEARSLRSGCVYLRYAPVREKSGV